MRKLTIVSIGNLIISGVLFLYILSNLPARQVGVAVEQAGVVSFIESEPNLDKVKEMSLGAIRSLLRSQDQTVAVLQLLTGYLALNTVAMGFLVLVCKRSTVGKAA